LHTWLTFAPAATMALCIADTEVRFLRPAVSQVVCAVDCLEHAEEQESPFLDAMA
jgi:hypothetical protein